MKITSASYLQTLATLFAGSIVDHGIIVSSDSPKHSELFVEHLLKLVMVCYYLFLLVSFISDQQGSDCLRSGAIEALRQWITHNDDTMRIVCQSDMIKNSISLLGLPTVESPAEEHIVGALEQTTTSSSSHSPPSSASAVAGVSKVGRKIEGLSVRGC